MTFRYTDVWVGGDSDWALATLWVPEMSVRWIRRSSFRGRAVGSVGSSVVAGRSERIAVSLFYWSLRRILELLVLRRRSEREKEIEILLLVISCGCWSVRLLVRN